MTLFNAQGRVRLRVAVALATGAAVVLGVVPVAGVLMNDAGAGPTPAAATGTLKICKVAAVGVAVGAPFTFNVTGSMSATVSVPAGPAPGGYCKIVGSNFAVGSSIAVHEVIPAGDQVVSITSVPPPTSVNLTTGTVVLNIGAGVTEVTYTDRRVPAGSKTGFLEICKKINGPATTKLFTFTVGGTTISVPAGACSSAVQVIAGPAVAVTESLAPGFEMLGCATLPPANLVGCNLATRTATVKVVAGGVALETILTVTNDTCVTVHDAVITTGTPTLTSATAHFNVGHIGSSVTGPGIPAGTTIVAVTATTITMSNVATLTGSGLTVTYC